MTDLLVEGDNELRFIISDGWYRGRCGPSRVPDNFGTSTALLTQLDIEAVEGRQIIGSDPTWETRTGAIPAADLMDGQTTDFTNDATSWSPVISATDPLPRDWGRFAFSPAPAVKRIREYRPRTYIPKWLRSLADDQLETGCIANVAPNTGVVNNPHLPISFDGLGPYGQRPIVDPI